MGYLITHEDPFHVHKTLGVASIVHYLYVFATFARGDVDVEKRPVLVLMHAFLSLSSLVFRVPTRRVKTDRPMIWKEFRLHNIVFACRSFACILLWSVGLRCQWIVVFLTMSVADVITWRLGSEQDKTMRAMPTPYEWTDVDYAPLQRLYALAQFAATMSCTASPDLAMLVAMPVQTSAFLMTLVRKGKMSPRQWHIVYAFTLWIVQATSSTALFWREMPFMNRIVFSCLGARIRRRFNVNKYVLWAVILLCAEMCPTQIPWPAMAWGIAAVTVYDAVNYVRIFARLG